MRASLDASIIPEPVDVVVCDASFIGPREGAGGAAQAAQAGRRLVALVKPQFEAGARKSGKGGVVRDPRCTSASCARRKTGLSRRAGACLG
jgi:23S rRNA (cytidine1920-2'-O)/16S rRNA (cytidine1409-2'-O)-methyltransferase